MTSGKEDSTEATGPASEKEAFIPTRVPATPKVSRLRWQSPPEYDDESLLLDIRLRNPRLGWTAITNLFNHLKVPPKRSRTVDAVTNKGNSLMRAYGISPSSAAPVSAVWDNMDHQDDWTQVR